MSALGQKADMSSSFSCTGNWY
jgi:hypothetical protein